METKEAKINTMSPFCEAVMDATEELNQLKGVGDSALVLVSDGERLACRMAGNPGQMEAMLVVKMREDPFFRLVVSTALNRYIAEDVQLKMNHDEAILLRDGKEPTDG